MEKYKYKSAKTIREAKVQGHLDSLNKTAKILEEEWEKIEKGHCDLEAKKESLSKQNGGSNISDNDILDINAGGQIVRVSRGTLTQVKGSRLEAIFSGRWEKQLQRDSKGRIFLDVNPTCFKIIVDYLNECKIAPPDAPPDLPYTDFENQVFLDALLKAFGLYDHCPVDSTILTDPNHVRALTRFLDEDNVGSGLSLLHRGTLDGMNAASFHQKCDNQGPTITVVKSSGNYIFGGFADTSWRTPASAYDYVSSGMAFLFGLFCHGGQEPVKMRLKPSVQLNALRVSASFGPTFGGGHDLAIMANDGCTNSTLGNTYSVPPGGNAYYFTGGKECSISEIEVFQVTKTQPKLPTLPASPTPPWHNLTFDDFPDDIQDSFRAEKEALIEASVVLARLQDSFEKEQTAVQIFCSGDDDEIALMNVSGCTMAVKHSTLAKYPDSVLYKQFADTNWNGKRKRKVTPCNWDKAEVVAWSKQISGLSEDVSSYFQDSEVTGSELVAFEREDVKDLGVERPGTVALIMKAIRKLRNEEEGDSATFIEHSDYCFGKIIDQMRLKAMSNLDVPDPGPPEIREPDRKRFKRIVEYYFPSRDLASQFLK